jgi:hypothetical protein
MSEVVFIITIILIINLVVLLFSFIGLCLLIWMHYKYRNLRDQVDGIFDTCANTDELLAYQAQQEQITASQN